MILFAVLSCLFIFRPEESFLIEKGFCPGLAEHPPSRSAQLPSPGPLDYRFNGHAFVLSVLAQVLNPHLVGERVSSCCSCCFLTSLFHQAEKFAKESAP